MSKLGTALEQLRDQPDDELKQQLARTRDDLFRLHLGQYTNQVTSTASLTTKRREIARILTILRGRELGIDTQAQKKANAASSDSPATEDKSLDASVDAKPAKKSKGREKKAKS
jgi:large subunit ribosomal protein L29